MSIQIILYQPNGQAETYDNIVGFVRWNDRLFEFTFHDINGIAETVRTNLPFKVLGESPEEINECDKTWDRTMKPLFSALGETKSEG